MQSHVQNRKPRPTGGTSVHWFGNALAVLLSLLAATLLAALARLLLLLTGLLPATLLTATLLLLARLLVRILILILVHSVIPPTLLALMFEDYLRDSLANKITSREMFRSVCNGIPELDALSRVPFLTQT